ncbi:30S ribosomal protein S21 [Candidatus Methylomirabilis limnetica]|jgi:small subunit ribosomal protein S21|uniref:Small ribosomal subunit protein bS21 n=1 Tax=Candidatus Methylomirabilis limnetica TaxID=2033718 RepID=A0A2T4TWW8_9BACT|nr:30S ribosomal protein S21 [Candidatus Methylomirabilis limnetica]PTL35606.1 30S ribosomal protein S21 [Candidatus Methylomirabilis limnetica]
MALDDGTEETGGGSRYDKGTRHRPLEVKVDGRGVESALRLFKKLILRDGILKELKRRAHYEKPGEKRRRKVREAARRLRRQAARAVRRDPAEF